MITVERLRELLNYDPLTGVFTWRVKSSNRAPIGSVAGCLRPDGYHVIHIDGRQYRAHRLAWLYVHSAWPAEQIDHINGEPGDNRLCNLREATNAQNAQNQRAPKKHGTSGYLGVSWRKDRGKWRAEIRLDGVMRYLGLFSNPELAHAAYVQAKRSLHPGGNL